MGVPHQSDAPDTTRDLQPPGPWLIYGEHPLPSHSRIPSYAFDIKTECVCYPYDFSCKIKNISYDLKYDLYSSHNNFLQNIRK